MSCCTVHSASSLHCEWADESSDFQPDWMISRILHTCEPSLQSVPAFPQICRFTEWFFVLTTFVWLLARVSPQVSPLNNSLDWMSCCIVHSAHLCFFSPLWMSKWVLRFPAQLNDFTHCAHLWAFSPECASTCFLRSVVSLNYFLHRVHLCRFSSGCACKRVLRWETCLNYLLHSVHL